MKKSLTTGLSALALATAAASVALVGNTAGHAASAPSSAYGIGATGVAPIEPTPYVESTDGALVEDSLVEIPGDPVVSAGVVNVGAEQNHAYASVTDISLGDGLLAKLPADLTDPIQQGCNELATELAQVEGGIQDGTTEVESFYGELSAELNDGTQDTSLDVSLLDAINEDLTALQLAAVCDALAGEVPLASIDSVEAECTGATGDTTVGDLTLLGGLDVDIDTETLGSALGIEDALIIREGRETTNADGSYTIDGLTVQLLPGTEAESEVVISSATCGSGVSGRAPAPRPTPVEANLPVTG